MKFKRTVFIFSLFILCFSFKSSFAQSKGKVKNTSEYSVVNMENGFAIYTKFKLIDRVYMPVPNIETGRILLVPGVPWTYMLRDLLKVQGVLEADVYEYHVLVKVKTGFNKSSVQNFVVRFLENKYGLKLTRKVLVTGDEIFCRRQFKKILTSAKGLLVEYGVTCKKGFDSVSINFSPNFKIDSYEFGFPSRKLVIELENTDGVEKIISFGANKLGFTLFKARSFNWREIHSNVFSTLEKYFSSKGYVLILKSVD